MFKKKFVFLKICKSQELKKNMFFVYAHIFLMIYIYHKNSIIFPYYLISNGDDGLVVTVFKSSLMSITLSGDSYSIIIRVSTPAGATALRCGIILPGMYPILRYIEETTLLNLSSAPPSQNDF